MSRLRELLDRPIAYHRAFVPIAGVAGAVMLSQAIYWSKRTNDSDGWFFKTIEAWEKETGLTRREQETARRRLSGILIAELRGIPARLYFCVDFSALEKALSHGDMNEHNDDLSFNDYSLSNSAKLDCTKAPNLNGGNRQTDLHETAKMRKDEKLMNNTICEDFLNAHRLHTETTTETTKNNNKEAVVESFSSKKKENSGETQEAVNLLVEVGFQPNIADKLARKHEAARIFQVVQIAERIRPNNLQGYISSALAEGWNLKSSEKETPSASIDRAIGMALAEENQRYKQDLEAWASLPYPRKRRHLASGGYGSNSDYPDPNWLRRVLSLEGFPLSEGDHERNEGKDG